MHHKRTPMLFIALLAVLATAFTAGAQPDDGGLEIGGRVDGALRNNALSARYPFTGVAGDVVTFTVRSDDFDTFLILENESGIEITRDDDSAGNLDSRIGPFVLPQSGEYTVVVTSFSRSDTGNFTLSVEAPDIRPIEYTQTIDSTLTEDRLSALYRFRGQTSDVIAISLNSDDFDAFLTLSESGDVNAQLASNDDSGGSLNSRIGPFTLPRTGDYLITASSLSGNDTGAFTLRLDRVALQGIAYDDTVEAVFTGRTQEFFFSFEADPGDVVQVAVQSNGTLDTTLELIDPDNFQIMFDDDGGAGFDPEFERIILDQSGTHTLVLRPFADGATGTATLTLARGELRSLDGGSQQVALNDKVSEDALTFTGVAGERVRLIVESTSGARTSPNINVMQGEMWFADAGATDVARLAVDFTVPADGTVVVRLQDFGFATALFEVSLERSTAETTE